MDRPETYSADEAAKLLGITRRRVLQLIQEGELEGEREGAEPGSPWRVTQRSVHARRDAKPPRSRPSEAAQGAADSREYQERVEALQRELGRLEGRLELEAVTRSTLQEQLDRERDRADRLEAELTDARRGFWRRLFGG